MAAWNAVSIKYCYWQKSKVWVSISLTGIKWKTWRVCVWLRVFFFFFFFSFFVKCVFHFIIFRKYYSSFGCETESEKKQHRNKNNNSWINEQPSMLHLEAFWTFAKMSETHTILHLKHIFRLLNKFCSFRFGNGSNLLPN